jgi:hypothetical protein
MRLNFPPAQNSVFATRRDGAGRDRKKRRTGLVSVFMLRLFDGDFEISTQGVAQSGQSP